MKENISGLSLQEVEERRRQGHGEGKTESITKKTSQIIYENVVTLFNFLNFMIAGLLFAVGAYSNMLFIAIIICNICIGIFQELKAKRLVDELSILNRPSVKVMREGREMQIGMEEIVKDDLMVLEAAIRSAMTGLLWTGLWKSMSRCLPGKVTRSSKKGKANCIPEAL